MLSLVDSEKEISSSLLVNLERMARQCDEWLGGWISRVREYVEQMEDLLMQYEQRLLELDQANQQLWTELKNMKEHADGLVRFILQNVRCQDCQKQMPEYRYQSLLTPDTFMLLCAECAESLARELKKQKKPVEIYCFPS